MVTFKILQDGDEMLFKDILLHGLKLLEMDALGGSGSRGYGRIAFEFSDKEVDDKFKALNPF
jgi:CRISPR-associated protein Csm3